MEGSIDFSNKTLVEIGLGYNHDKVHPAWQDDTNEGYQICYELTLVFTDATYLVKPCEVKMVDRYPSLGLDIQKHAESALPHAFHVPNLPQIIKHTEASDFLGEDVVNQYVFTLQDGSELTIRHVFPPMSMGIKYEAASSKSD